MEAISEQREVSQITFDYAVTLLTDDGGLIQFESLFQFSTVGFAQGQRVVCVIPMPIMRHGIW